MSDDPVSNSDIEDIDIVIRILDGDEAALRLLLDIHGPKVRGALYSKYGSSVPQSLLDDALHRAAYTVWKKVDQFDEDRGSLGGWMTKMAMFEVVNILREGRNQKEVQVDDLATIEAEEPEEVQLSPERLRQLQDVRDIVDSLPHHQKVISEMDLASGCDTDNDLLADILGTTKGSVYVSRRKARQKIEEEMRRRGHFR